MTQPFLLGVNYWPRRKAMYWWSEFDPGEVHEEFALIREVGLSIVRLFLLWDDFQPTPDEVSPAALGHLVTVCDIANEYDLKLDVTFFTGHMSGPNWSPRWLLGGPVMPMFRQLVSGGRVVSGGYRNPYTDPVALRAQRLLLRTVVGRLKDHPTIWMWNLGNEPDLFAHPPDSATGQAWVRDMVGTIRELDTQHLITCGLHMASLNEDNGLRIDQVFAETDIAVMHAYPMYTPWARGPLDPDFVPYTCALTAALSGKPVLMEEFGGCTAPPDQPSQVWEWELLGRPRKQFMASEADLAAYLAAVLPRLVEVGAIGAMVWCFADYAPELWDRPPCGEFRHERFFGLVRPDSSLKPHARVLRDFAATNPTVQPEPSRGVKLPVSADAYYRDPKQHLVSLYQQFVKQLTSL